MLKRIVITGATSAIGCALIDECIKQNIEVMAIVNRGSNNIKNIPISELVTVYECSLAELEKFALSGETDECKNQPYDAMIHLAWQATSGMRDYVKIQPQAMNIKYSLDAVEVAKRLGCRAFIGAGSQAEFGRTEEILTESTITDPETPYGIAKLCVGQLTRLACKQYGIKHIWPRILSAYGPKTQPQSLINYTIRELLNGREPSLSKGEQVWDLIYTGDVAKALLLLIEKGSDGEVYVIGSGESKPLKEYLEKVRELINPGIKLRFGEIPYGENQVMHLSCDISKLKQDTGFVPMTSFEEGVMNIADWIRETTVENR